MLSFKVTREEATTIGEIARRAVRNLEAIEMADRYEQKDIVMDLIVTHANGCPLDFKAMLEGDDSDFMHDILEIRNHINRETGKLDGIFWPRFALRQ